MIGFAASGDTLHTLHLYRVFIMLLTWLQCFHIACHFCVPAREVVITYRFSFMIFTRDHISVVYAAVI